MIFRSVLFLSLSFFSLANDDHADGENCACVAEDYGFDIDCTASQVLLDALVSLESNNCNIDCSSQLCESNFYIVQAHHDFCLHNEVPDPVEESFHIYESTCKECKILRKRDPSLTNCPSPVCDGRGDEAYLTLLANDCFSDCSTSVCASAYQVLRSEHDSCADGTMGLTSESGIHDAEDICKAFNCNTLTDESRVAEQLVCIHEKDDESDATTIVPNLMGLTGGIFIILLMF
jgi:hypothetical protein